MSSADLDRRAFLSAVGRYTGGVCAACSLGPLVDRACGDAVPLFTREVDHYEQLPGNKIQCFVCPLHCVLSDGETCFCRTRTNVGGKLFTRAHGNPCILRIDPIEKLPLSHYRPGTEMMTIAVGGCNLRCLYCQNWQQSQKLPDELKTLQLSPREAVAAARKRRVGTIAFSYTEPVTFLEYAKDIAVLAKKAGLKVVVATAAFVEPGPLLEFAEYVDAFVVSLKGFSEEFYRRVTGVRLAPVLTAIQTLCHESDCWVELVNLVVPTYNDDVDEIRQMAEWIHTNLGDEVPLHFERFVPAYRLKNLPRTSVQTLEAARAVAGEAGLRYVYISNLSPHEGNNTFCPRCGEAVIQRLGFKVLENSLRRNACPHCGNRLPGVWR